jgi:O-methyltransferase
MMVTETAASASGLNRFYRRAKRAVHRRIRAGISSVIFRTIGYLCNRYRLPVVIEHRPDSDYDFGRIPDYGRLFQAWTKGNRPNNTGDLARLYMLILNFEQTLGQHVEGSFAELGVYKGNSAALLAHFARRHNRQLYLFDTFSGFDRRDLKGVDSVGRIEFTDTSLEGVRAFVGEDRVTYVPGFFPASAETIEMPEKLAIAHIDCDLYEPMRAALERFYPIMSPGGLLIMHDYSSGHWPGATKAVDEFFADKPESPILMPDKSGSAVVRIARR